MKQKRRNLSLDDVTMERLGILADESSGLSLSGVIRELAKQAFKGRVDDPGQHKKRAR